MLKLITPPTAPAVSLDDVKAFVKILDNDDDVILTAMNLSAETHVQNICNIQLSAATYEWYESSFLSRMPLNPVKGIEKIEYLVNGVYVLLSDTSYYVYEKNGVSYLSFSSVPSHDTHEMAIKITFIAGYDETPAPIASYILVKVSTLYENRESYVIGSSLQVFNDDLVKNLLLPYKIRPI